MKYSSNNKPIQCFMTNSTCYKKTNAMNVKGILWHSTNTNNPYLNNYVQPSSNDINYNLLINLLGKNIYNNDWNHISVQAGTNAWIGKAKDNSIISVQTMPWTYKSWSCGSGINGSCNNGWIQIEICEDNLKNKTYFNQVYLEACELTAYLCQLYQINPEGIVTYNTIEVPTIICQKDSFDLGLGVEQNSLFNWLSYFNKTIDNVRTDVQKLIAGLDIVIEEPKKQKEKSKSLQIGDEIQLKQQATYLNGKTIPNWILNTTLYIKDIRKDKNIVFSTQKTGPAAGIISPNMIMGQGADILVKTRIYKVKVNANIINIYKGPGMQYDVAGIIKDQGVYTITETIDTWGKLQDDRGWICLEYTSEIH